MTGEFVARLAPTDRAIPRALPALASVALGAAAATGFAPLDLWPLTVLSFAGWLWLLRRAASLRGALWLGWLFGLGHFTINNNWIQHAFDFQDAMPPALGYFAVVGLALYLAVYPMLAAGLTWRWGRGGAELPFVAAAAWIATEWLRAGMFTGYAWNPLGVAWLPVPGIARVAAWIGTHALSGVTLLVAGALLLALERRRLLAAVILLPVVALALLPVPPAPPADPSLRVRIVQPDTPQEMRSRPDFELRNYQALARMSGRPGTVPRLVLWPEGAITGYPEGGYPYYYYDTGSASMVRRAIADLLGPGDVLVGGGTALHFDRARRLDSAANTVFAIDADARLVGRYDKAHLVPYGEYLPMRPLLSRIGLSRLVPGDVDFLSGPGPRALTLPRFGAIGIQVCYEIIFSGEVVDRAHRPRALFNPSNDAWFGSWGPPQHLAQARMRALEEGLPVLRSTPTGISAIIDAHGRLLATVPHGRAGAIELPMPSALPPTLFARAGNGMVLLVVLLLAGLAVAIARRRR